MTAPDATAPLTARDMTPARIVETFSPAWFAAVMGTAVVPLAIGFAEGTWVRPVAGVFTLLAMAMFALALGPWTLRWFRYPRAVARDLEHPIAASFLPTMPIAMHVIALDLLRYPDLLLPRDAALNLALWLWAAGSLGIYVLGYVVLLRVYRHAEIGVQHANFGWFIPPVSKLLIPVAGFELAGHFPGAFDLIAGLSLASLGVGFFLYVFVGAAVYHRYKFAPLPPGRLAATFFIGMAPPAILAVGLGKLSHLVAHHGLLDLSPALVGPLVKLLVVGHWGFAAWWFVMGLVLIGHYVRGGDLPFAMSWWAFIFPSGALAVASGLAWQLSGWGWLGWVYWGVLVWLVGIWVVVFWRTVAGVVSRGIFVPVH
jgi:C4-dicarboxylate transporter/malic acid transport protein